MVLKIFIDVSIQPERFNILFENSIKYKKLEKYHIKIVENYKNSDLILFLVNSQKNIINLDKEHEYIYQTNIPIIILERQDTAITWVRNFEKIKNLKAVFKNRKLRKIQSNNTNKTYYGKHQFYYIHKNFKLNELKSDNATDLGISHYSKNTKLKEINSNNLEKIMCVLWDFHSSPLCRKLSMNYFRTNPINFNKGFFRIP